HPCAPNPPSAFFFYASADLRDLHSFPTRRSSDLDEQRAIRPNQSHHIARSGGKHQNVWRDFRKARRLLPPARRNKHKPERKPNLHRRAEPAGSSKTFHGAPPLAP